MTVSDELALAKNIIDGDLELLCPEMQLLSCPNYQNSLFEGTGIIRSDTEGRLSFNIVGRYEHGFPPLLKCVPPAHGQVPEPEDYVMLRAVDFRDREWRSNWILMPRPYPCGMRLATWNVAGELESLINMEQRQSSDESEGRLYIYLPGPLFFDQATHITTKVGEKVVKQSWSADHHECTISSAKVEFRQYDLRWLTVRARASTPIMPDWAGLMCQALSLATAQTVRPVVAVREFNSRRRTGIFSGPFSYPRSYLTRPVPPTKTEDFWLLVRRFVEWAESLDDALATSVFVELEGIRNGAMGSIHTAAVTLATAVESLANLLLTNVGSDLEPPEGYESLMEHIRAWDGDDATRHRALSILGSLKNVRAVDRLYRFATDSDTPTELVTVWKRLRDSAVHGGLPTSYQLLTDQYYSTVELLYRLLAYSMGYEGSICSTSIRGWGLDEWGFPVESKDDD